VSLVVLFPLPIIFYLFFYKYAYSYRLTVSVGDGIRGIGDSFELGSYWQTVQPIARRNLRIRQVSSHTDIRW